MMRRLAGALAVLLALLAAGVPRAAMAADDAPLGHASQIGPAIQACIVWPKGLEAYPFMEITVIFSLKRSGELIGPPRLTFASFRGSPEKRAILIQETVKAIEGCMPLHMTEALGAAMAGRLIRFKLTYRQGEERDT